MRMMIYACVAITLGGSPALGETMTQRLDNIEFQLQMIERRLGDQERQAAERERRQQIDDIKRAIDNPPEPRLPPPAEPPRRR